MKFPGDESLIGEIIRVKIEKAGYPYNIGQVVKVVSEDMEKTAVSG